MYFLLSMIGFDNIFAFGLTHKDDSSRQQVRNLYYAVVV
jgi:hypothetical protein